MNKVKIILKLLEESVDRKPNKILKENYGTELDKLQKAFNTTVQSMRGSSAANPKQIWIDLGVRNQFCNEEGELFNYFNDSKDKNTGNPNTDVSYL